jgi:hypothetical protein
MLKVFAIRACAAVTCLSAFGALGATSAAAATSPAGILIGPIKAAHGYSVTVAQTACPPSSSSGLTIEFSKGSKLSISHELSISHDYSGGASTCSVVGKLSSGFVSARWGRLATIKVRIKKVGKVKKLKPPRGCTGRVGTERRAVATGTLKIAIHPGVFGRIKVRKAAAFLQRFGTLSCHPSGATDVTVLGTFGGLTLSATQPAKGRRSVLISGTGATLAGGIKDEVFLDAVGGSSLFNVAPSLASATIGKAGSLLEGSMTFTGLPACAGSPGARNGSFSGSLVVRDPVLGSLTLAGSQATDGFIAMGSAVPGQCNGPNSTPATAAFTNQCSGPGICSVSSHSNTDMFVDESDPGTQGPIKSETWNFGDGTSAPGIPVGAPVSHTYAIAGTYTVTLTLIDGQGVTHKATETSYIGP